MVLTQEDKILLQKRPQKGLLAGLWELPNREGHLAPKEVEDYVKTLGGQVLKISPLPQAKHIFTHITWEMIGYQVEVRGVSLPQNGVWADPTDLSAYAIPSAFSAYRGEAAKTNN